MNERDLRYLLAIADCGSLAAASDRLGVTQPALTKCIDRLEDATRAELFLRKGRNIEPSPAGEVLVRRARSMLLGFDETLREIADHAAGERGHVRLGAAATVTESVVPRLIAGVTARGAGITLELTLGMSDVLRIALREDRIDLMVCPRVTMDDEFDYEPLMSDRVVVVGRSGHPLARQAAEGRALALEEMTAFEWVLPPESVLMRRWLDHTFERARLPKPRVRVEVNSLVLMPQLIGDTNLLSFTSDQKLAAAGLVEIAHPDTTHERAFGIHYRKDGYRSAATRRVAALLAGAD